jgi:hypothetical protein
MQIPWPIEKGMEKEAQAMDGRVLTFAEPGKSERVVEIVDGEENVEKEQDSKVAMRWKMISPEVMSVIVDEENVRRMAKINFFDNDALLYYWHLSNELNTPLTAVSCPEAIGVIAFLLRKFKHGRFHHLGTIRRRGGLSELPDCNVAIFSAPYSLPNEVMIFNMCFGVLHIPPSEKRAQEVEKHGTKKLEEADIHAVFIAHKCWHCKKPCNTHCKTCHMAIFCSDECHNFAQSIHSQVCNFPRLTYKQQQCYNAKWDWIS